MTSTATAAPASMTNLPAIDPGGPIRTAANDLVNAAKDVSDHATNIQRTWSKLSPVYQAPEQHLVLAAMDPPANTADELLKDARSAKKALDTFADACDSLIRSKRVLISDFATFENSDHGDPEDPRADKQYVHARHGFDLRAQAIAQGVLEAEQVCYMALMAIGTPPAPIVASSSLGPGPSAAVSGSGPSLVFLPRPPGEPLPVIPRDEPAPVEPPKVIYPRDDRSLWEGTKEPFVNAWNDVKGAGSGARTWWSGVMGGFAAGTTNPTGAGNRRTIKQSNERQAAGAQKFAHHAPLVAINFVGTKSGGAGMAAGVGRRGAFGEHVDGLGPGRVADEPRDLSGRGLVPAAGTRVRPAGIPNSWRVVNSRGSGGTLYHDPRNKGHAVRVMQGDPDSPYKNSQAPYVRWQRHGQPLDASGNVLPSAKVEEAHIPLNEFRFEPGVFKP